MVDCVERNTFFRYFAKRKAECKNVGLVRILISPGREELQSFYQLLEQREIFSSALNIPPITFSRAPYRSLL